MILKARVQSFHAVHDPSERWIYIDGIRQVQSYGYAIPQDDGSFPEDDHGRNRISCNRAELRKYVDDGWGTDRSFSDELWPEFRDETEQQTVTIVRLAREPGDHILALLVDTAFLMSDDGKTIDRLR